MDDDSCDDQQEKDFVFVKHFNFLNGYQKGKNPYFNLSLPFVYKQFEFESMFI